MLILLIPSIPQPIQVAADSVTQLKSYQIVQYHLPSGSSGPWTITSDSAGNVWFVEQDSNQIGSFDPVSKMFHEYSIPTAKSLPQDLAPDQAGNVWFTELSPSKLGELTPSSGSMVEHSIPIGAEGIPCGPIGVTIASDGNVWVTCEFSNQIDEYSPKSATFAVYDLPVPYSAPIQILFDNAGNFWFTASDSGMLGYATTSQLRNGTDDGISEFAPINSTYVGTITNALLPSGHVQTSITVPSGVAFSPDGGSLWITDHGASSFDRYDISSKTLVKYYTSRPASGYPESLPNGIAVDSAGDIWITEHYGNRIAEFDPATGRLVEYPIPCCQSTIAGTLYLTLGANGSVWFTEYGGNSIAEVSPMPGWAAPSISLNPNTLTNPTGNSSVNVEVSSGSGNSSIAGRVTLAISGISWNGELQNVTASFSPPVLTVGQNQTASSTLRLQTRNLKPGAYLLTVEATSSESGVTSGRILQLVIRGSPGAPSPWLLAGAALLVVGACAFVIALRRRAAWGGGKAPG